MNVFVVNYIRHAITSDGTLWTAHAPLRYPFWQRYLDVFDEVRLLARARPCQEPPDGWQQASGPGVVAVPIPYYEGPVQYAKAVSRINAVIDDAIADAQALALRVPAPISAHTMRALRSGRPYSVEVCGDPYESFGPATGSRHPLQPFFRWWYTKQLRQQCFGACAAAYVTETSLQRRYPPGPGAFTTHFSSIELTSEAIAETPRKYRGTNGPVRVVAVGSLAQLYKGPDVLIDAIDACRKAGVDLSLTWVGDGKYRQDMLARVADLGLQDRIDFIGQLSTPAAVRERLDEANLFVLPSRTEGLPKAIIEAMARGLPCIGTSVGGIPELLPPEDMVPPGDAPALASRLREVLPDGPRLNKMAHRNLEKAKAYRNDILRQRRIAFYRHLHDRTEEWLWQHRP